MTTYFSVLAWGVPRTVEPGGLQSVASQRVRHNLVTIRNQKVGSCQQDSWSPPCQGRHCLVLQVFPWIVASVKSKCWAKSRHQVYIKVEKWSNGGTSGSILFCQKSKHSFPLVSHQPKLYQGGSLRATCGSGGSGGSPSPQWSLPIPAPHSAAALVPDAALQYHPPCGKHCGPTSPCPPTLATSLISSLSLLLIRTQNKRHGLEFTQVYIKNISLVQASEFLMSNKLQETSQWFVTWWVRIAGGNGQNAAIQSV